MKTSMKFVWAASIGFGTLGFGGSASATPIDGRKSAVDVCTLTNEEIVLVGGGNSAGQAAVFLSSFAAKIWMLVRGPSLAERMSQYLIDRIKATGTT